MKYFKICTKNLNQPTRRRLLGWATDATKDKEKFMLLGLAEVKAEGKIRVRQYHANPYITPNKSINAIISVIKSQFIIFTLVNAFVSIIPFGNFEGSKH